MRLHSHQREVPPVTVIMPAYNRAATIVRAIRSLCRQTWTDFECIIVDDGSTDETGARAQRCIGGDPRFHFLRQDENCGVGPAAALGAQRARGAWLTRLDSDDEYLPEHLALRLAHVQAHPQAEFLYGTMLVRNGPDHVPDFYGGPPIPVSASSQGATTFLRRSAYARLGGWAPVRFGEDALLFAKARKAGIAMQRVPYATYVYYRDTENALTRNWNAIS